MTVDPCAVTTIVAVAIPEILAPSATVPLSSDAGDVQSESREGGVVKDDDLAKQPVPLAAREHDILEWDAGAA